MTGLTLDTGALIAFESGSKRMRALCAADRGHPVITSDPDDIRAIDPALTLLSPG